MQRPLSDEPSDESLVQIIQRDPLAEEGRRAASVLLGRHARRVTVWCWRYVRDEERAMDLAQDVLLAAYRGIGSFGGRSRFSAWLFSIARNRCLNEIALRKPAIDPDADFEGLIAPDAGAERVLETEQEHARLQSVLLAHLDPMEAKAVWLAVVERFPIDEVTRILNLDNASGARGVLQRARRRLRAGLDRGDLRSDP